MYLIQGELDQAQRARIATELLADPVTQIVSEGASDPSTGCALIEVHPLAGVTDTAADSVEIAVRALLGTEVTVQTGTRFELDGVDTKTARSLIERTLANPVIHGVHDTPYFPDHFASGSAQQFEPREVALCELSPSELDTLSRKAHLFLDQHEMLAIQAAYREAGREPREIELETLAQTWSEHCVHKTLKARIRFEEPQGKTNGVSIAETADARPHHTLIEPGVVEIDNLLKATVAAATHELMADGIDWCLSVFVDNAGIVAFDDETAVCFKVETHNHPSALEPYGGAATGIGGCIRDIMGTGLAAKPIAATDVFCVGPNEMTNVPTGCLHPRRVLSQIVGGVRDYGNRMGIPTLNGAVWFDEAYVGNPLVYCGCVGVMPIDMVSGDAQPGDRIIAIGGRTGRDGIHGATFSSAELTDTHADEFSHAVQIGHAITEKKALDAILALRDAEDGCLFTAITDCGAGGFSSAVGEMGELIGAEVELANAPLKYEGLSPTEIWISEAQERMVLAIPQDNMACVQEICDAYEVELCDLGVFGTPNCELILNYHGREFGRLSMSFMHDGIPMPTRTAVWDPEVSLASSNNNAAHSCDGTVESILATTCALLRHPNIASKSDIIRQYDHEVQGGSVIKPLVGVGTGGPSDGAVIKPSEKSQRGLAIANGLATGLAADPYVMGLAAIDECVRNLVCVGGDPERIAILDNFCWPSCGEPRMLGSLVRAAEACYDGAKAYRTPFISGKDSLNNQFTTENGETIRIPPTLLISGMAILEDAERAISMDLKSAGSVLLLVGATGSELGGSHLAMLGQATSNTDLPLVDLERGPATARAVARAIGAGLVRSAHDLSEGGLLVAAAEMAFAGGLGVELDLDAVPTTTSDVSPIARAFAEHASRYLLEVNEHDLDEVCALFESIPVAHVGTVCANDHFTLQSNGACAQLSIDVLRDAWQKNDNHCAREDNNS